MNRFLYCFLFSTFLFTGYESYSQGCSDGGVCSAGSLALVQVKFRFEILPSDEHKLLPLPVAETALDTTLLHKGKEKKDPIVVQTTKSEGAAPSVSDSIKKSTSSSSLQYFYQYPKYFFQYTTSFGLGDEKTSIVTTQLEGNMRIINQKLFAQIKLPYLFINGKLASINGLGDVAFNLSYVACSKKNSDLSFTAGVKIPINRADLSKNNLPLPMVYQTSLGSTDLLCGIKYTYKKWDFTVGYQHSFHTNNNAYLHRAVVTDSAVYNSYFESNILRRSDDGVFRINRNFSIKKIDLSAGLLAIYHLTDDYYSTSAGERKAAIGSGGLTLNLNLASVIPISKKLDFVFIYGSPVITRASRPDGLTRMLVALVGLKYRI